MQVGVRGGVVPGQAEGVHVWVRGGEHEDAPGVGRDVVIIVVIVMVGGGADRSDVHVAHPVQTRRV